MRRHQGPATLLAIVLLLGAAPAAGAVEGFSINSISGVGDLEGEIDDRLKDEFRVNYKDCLLYLGQYETPVVADGEVVVEEDPSEDVVTHEDTLVPEEDVEEADVDPADGAAHKPSFGKADDTGSLTPRILLKWSVSSIYSGFDYAVKVGSCSDTGSISDEETDTCRYVVTRTDLDGYSNNEIFIELPDLLGDECDEGDTGSAALYFFFQDGDYTETKIVEVVDFKWDYEAPVPPSKVTLAEGEKNLKVSWTDESNSGDITYNVYWDTAAFTDADLTDVSKKKDLTAKSYTISGLPLGEEVFVGVVAVDNYDNESKLSTLENATPVNVDDFWEQYKNSGGDEAGGYCFVATAAWGSPMAPKVMVLRRFRDQILLGSAFGRALVDTYYVEGPALARLIEGRPLLRGATRLLLWPLVGAAWLAVEWGAAAPLGLLLALAVGLLALRRRRLNRNARRVEA
ncbi:MAG: fibronectin type III domain-containing protein [Pseudomonadota bacterium]